MLSKNMRLIQARRALSLVFIQYITVCLQILTLLYLTYYLYKQTTVYVSICSILFERSRYIPLFCGSYRVAPRTNSVWL